MSATNLEFYNNLRSFDRFDGITMQNNLHTLPSDWLVILTDVVNSTQAVENGLFKEVNMIGAAGIAAIGNLTSEVQIPFVFGGDGATMAIPKEFYQRAKESLADVQKISLTFGLELRAGIIPVSDILDQGFALQVAKWQVDDRHNQALVSGNGWDWAENEIKRNPSSTYLVLDVNPNSKADLTGFSCVWSPVPSPRGETLTLIIKSNSANIQESSQIPNSVLKGIESFYDDPNNLHPLINGQIQVDLGLGSVSHEQKLTKNLIGLAKLWSEADILLKRYFIKFIDLFKIRYNGVMIDDLRDGSYHADYRKFDNTLKLVITADEEQKKQILELLDRLENENKIKYGFFVSKETVITCFVADAKHLKVRFVDGKGGGYTMAAKSLKSKLKTS